MDELLSRISIELQYESLLAHNRGISHHDDNLYSAGRSMVPMTNDHRKKSDRRTSRISHSLVDDEYSSCDEKLSRSVGTWNARFCGYIYMVGPPPDPTSVLPEVCGGVVGWLRPVG